MRALILCVAGAALAVPAVASASVMTFGGSFATTCYHKAETRRPDIDGWRACDTALTIENLTPQDRAGTFVNRGILYMITGRTERAAADFAEAERIDPKQPEIYLNQALLAYQTQKPQQALELASKALAFGTRRPHLALYVRGVASEDLGQIRAAYADLNEAARLAPGWAEPRKELARYRVR